MAKRGPIVCAGLGPEAWDYRESGPAAETSRKGQLTIRSRQCACERHRGRARHRLTSATRPSTICSKHHSHFSTGVGNKR
jgi:hypothetical protein